MSQLTRMSNAARVFCVAAVLGLSLALLDPVALQGTVLLAALAATAVAADAASKLPQSWIVGLEAAVASIVVGMALPQGVLLLPYLVVPSLIAGITQGTWPVIRTVCIEIAGLALVVFSSGQVWRIETLSEVLGPWLLTTVGVGLLGARVRLIRAGPGIEHDSSYESARRLLSQLRTVARRLSSGLDSVSLASDLLAAVHMHLEDTHAAVFMRTDGGVLAPLAYRGANARDSLQPEGSLVDSCWHEMAPMSAIQAAGRSDRRHRSILPLRVGSRMIGVVISESGNAATPKVLHTLMKEVDEHALRLDAAMAFDEIRSIATMQERQRLAREIHDGVAQEIASLGYAVDDLAAHASSDLQRRKLNELRSELSRVVSELRLSIFDLRTEVSAGLGSALSDYVREMGARSGITVHTTLDVAPTRLRGEVETELFRIAQEAITNARKHSAAKNLWVDLRIRPPVAALTIRDDGQGLGSARADSFGIKVMRERAERIGAVLEISTSHGGAALAGTSVTITVGASAPAMDLLAPRQTEGS